MHSRGRGRGRGGGFGHGEQLPFKLFPVIEGLGRAQYSESNVQLIKWSVNLRKYWKSSPYFKEDRIKYAKKVQKPDIERYSDRNLRATKTKPPLWHYIKLDTDHVPSELARVGGEMKVVKNVRWNMELDPNKFDDDFKKIEQKVDGLVKENLMLRKADEEEEKGNEEEIEEDDEGEESDDDDYNENEYFDDDEDDFNMADDGDNEPFYCE